MTRFLVRPNLCWIFWQSWLSRVLTQNHIQKSKWFPKPNFPQSEKVLDNISKVRNSVFHRKSWVLNLLLNPNVRSEQLMTGLTIKASIHACAIKEHYPTLFASGKKGYRTFNGNNISRPHNKHNNCRKKWKYWIRKDCLVDKIWSFAQGTMTSSTRGRRPWSRRGTSYWAASAFTRTSCTKLTR